MTLVWSALATMLVLAYINLWQNLVYYTDPAIATGNLGILYFGVSSLAYLAQPPGVFVSLR